MSTDPSIGRSPRRLPSLSLRSFRHVRGWPGAVLARNWGALLALALFLSVGLAALDDYGLSGDEAGQRKFAIGFLDYLMGRGNAYLIGSDGLPSVELPRLHSFYGMVFQLPLLFVQRLFALEDSRSILLSSHMGIHLFFLAGGLFAYLLARSLLNNRLLSLFAMLLFLLHPVLYGHSFHSSKDIPFATLFIIALYLTRRAFKGEALLAFALLGVGAGALANLRIMGLILVAAVPALRALDLAFASGWVERKRILITTGAFALAGGLTLFALSPFLWDNPVRGGVEWWSTLANHPVVNVELFQGVFRRTVDFPPQYITVWFSITTPPFASFLGLIGGGAVLISAIRSPGVGLRNTRRRFGLALAGCFALPILGIALLDFHVVDKWRQVSFLWAPFSMLAALGLHWLTSALKSPRARRAALGAAGAGLAATLAAIALLHPNEQGYFNFLVDRVTPNYLRTQYPMEYWAHPMRQAIEHLLDSDASPRIAADASSNSGRVSLAEQLEILPEEDRKRIAASPADPDAVVFLHWPAPESGQALHRIAVFENTVLSVERKADLRSAYEASRSSSPLLRSAFDVHHTDDALIYVKEPCERREAARAHFKLWVIPVDASAVPEWRMPLGYEDLSFEFRAYGAFFDGKCVASVPLPDYAIARIRTGRTAPPDDGALWESTAALNADAARRARLEALAGEPLARSVYDIYRVNGDLVYVKERCAEADTEAKFFLHVRPERESDLPKGRELAGFDNRDFDFFLAGARFEGKCAARAPLPSYPIAGVRTGQFADGAEEIWSVDVPAE